MWGGIHWLDFLGLFLLLSGFVVGFVLGFFVLAAGIGDDPLAMAQTSAGEFR